MKEQYREAEVVQNITGIQFGVLSQSEMQQLSHFAVTTPDLYAGNRSRVPVENGVLDHRMVKFLMYFP